MKKKHFLILLALVLCLGGLTSCGGDDNCGDDEGGKTDVPQLSADAACYVISDADADIASIELTESGLYFIEQLDDSDYGAKKKAVSRKTVSKHKALSSSPLDLDDPSEDAILSGTYTKSVEGVYVLNGYGTMTVAANANGYAVKLQKLNGSETTYQASRVKSEAATTFDTQFCRTWKFDEVNFSMKYGSHSLADITAKSWKDFYTKLKKIAKENCDEEDPWTDEDEQDYNQMIANAETYGLKQAVFTAAGRLYMSYGPLVKGYLWKWKEGKAKTLLLWSYDTDLNDNGVADSYEWNSDIFFTTTDEPNFRAVTTVDIKNGKLTLTDTYNESDEDDGVEVKQTFKVTFSK